MVDRRWRRMGGPGVIVMTGLGLISALAPASAGAGPWPPMACSPDQDVGLTSARPASVDDLHQLPWYRLDPVVDAAGWLMGQRLTVGITGARQDRVLTLPPESFAAGPFGGAILVGSDDGRRSRLVAIDVARRCTTTIAESSDVIRSATVDPAGLAIHEHRVDRATRADLGIWRRPLDGGAATRWLAPMDPDPGFGPTWSTHLSWALDRDSLVIQSCAETACRIRVADPATVEVRTIADPTLGFAVGVAGDRVVAHAACPGLPCPLVSVDLTAGPGTGRASTGADVRLIEHDAGSATVVRSERGPRVVVETSTTDGPGLHDTAPDGSDLRDLGPLASGLRLGGDPWLDQGGLDLPDGWVLIAPGGELTGTDDRADVIARSVIDGRTIPLQEVLR